LKGEEMKKDLGIYIHIPFCKKKCEYCDFLSYTANERIKEAYVGKLIEEIQSYKKIASDYLVKTIFIGGGTPSFIEADQIATIMEELKRVFAVHKLNPEITIETNPGTLTKEKLLIYKSSGINRLSIGLQSTNNEELRLLGRIHTFEVFLENYFMAREIGFKNINIDLISGLPGQTVEAWDKTLEKVINLQPEHISAYSLIIEEGTPFFEKYQGESCKELLSEETDRKIYARTKERMERAKYHRYEISNYAKKGYECEHNTIYWLGTEYLGIGLGSSSFINHMRFRNEDNLEKYMKLIFDNNNRRNLEQLSRNQQIEEFVFLGLRMMEGVSKQKFMKLFRIEIEEVYGVLLKKLVREKLIIIEGDKIWLTDRGVDISNYVFAQFLID
jgi:oxygen-independent coproporphyrinogen III oxidase